MPPLSKNHCCKISYSTVIKVDFTNSYTIEVFFACFCNFKDSSPVVNLKDSKSEKLPENA